MKSNTIYIIDFREVIVTWSSWSSLYDLYRDFPLSQIIEAILSSDAYSDNSIFWDQLEYRNIEFNSLMETFYELIIEDIYRCIAKNILDDDSDIYVFKLWLDSTSIVLEKCQTSGF